MTQTCVVIDGNSLAHRAFHAYGRAEMTRTDGRPQEVCYGFLRLLIGVAEKIHARHGSIDHLVVGFDAPDSVRREWDAEYKATRKPTDESLRAQMGELRALLDAAGITQLECAGWEADDIAAAAAAIVRGTPETRLVVVTSDRDAIALVSDTVEVLQIRNGMDSARFLDPEAVLQAYGVHPSRYQLLAALRGDPSDNLAGISGLGPKKAGLVADRHATVEAISNDLALAELIGAKTAATLILGLDVVRHNLTMMAGVTDLDIPILAAPLPDAGQLTSALEAAELLGLARQCSRYLTAHANVASVSTHPNRVSPGPTRLAVEDDGALSLF